MNDTNVQAYLEFMIDVAVIFGANRTRAEKDMSDVLQFEIELAKVVHTPKLNMKEINFCHLFRFVAASLGI